MQDIRARAKYFEAYDKARRFSHREEAAYLEDCDVLSASEYGVLNAFSETGDDPPIELLLRIEEVKASVRAARPPVTSGAASGPNVKLQGEKKLRRCLGVNCGRDFYSTGPGNRICPRCATVQDYIYGFEGLKK